MEPGRPCRSGFLASGRHIQPWQHTPSPPENICRKFTICVARSEGERGGFSPSFKALRPPPQSACHVGERNGGTSRHEALHEHVSADMSEIVGHKWSRAMRAVKSDIETGNPEENFLRVLDQFASLRTYSSA